MIFSGAVFAFAVVPGAQAGYQQVGNFGGNPGELHLEGFANRSAWPEKVQLGGAGSMAVNYSGNGGVPKGTVYVAVSSNIQHYTYVSRYKPDGTLSERWEVKTQAEEEEAPGYERCGPEGSPTYLHCAPVSEGSEGTVKVAVDQTTGNVYVFRGENTVPGTKIISEYSADGSEVIARFGVQAPGGSKTAETPEMIHQTFSVTMAVNGTGEVYVNDVDGGNDNFYHRVMVFKPKNAGIYTEYEYAGQGRDIDAGFFNETPILGNLMVDSAGYLYSVAGSGGEVRKFDPSQPTQPPVCSSTFPKIVTLAAAVVPTSGELFKSGEIFLYDEATHQIHRLAACQGEHFGEVETIAISPRRTVVAGMAFDPASSFPGRLPGVLWASSPNGAGGKSKTTPSGREVESAMGYILAPASEVAPKVSEEAVSGVTSTAARLEGAVNPGSHTTSYFFQYISAAAYDANESGDRFAGADRAPLGETKLAGDEAIPVAVTIGTLAPGTEYRFRIVASNHCRELEPEHVCLTQGEDFAFSTYPSEVPGLADARAYELVSPAEKSGGQVFPLDPISASCVEVECKPGAPLHHFPMQATPNGEAVVFEGNPFSATGGAVIENEYISRRDGNKGWQTVNLTPPLLASKAGQGYKQFATDLSAGALESLVPSLSPQAPPNFANLYSQPTGDPLALAPLLTVAPPHRTAGSETNSLKIDYVGASDDLSRIFFAANDELNGEGAGGEAGEKNLYEWSAGALHLINVGTGGEPLPGAQPGSGEEAGQVVSADGTHVFWTSKAGQLYVRVDGSRTLEVPDTGKFLTASADGSRVLLKNGHLYGGLSEGSPTLIADLTQGESGFEGIAGQGEDLNHIYFVDTASLGDEENVRGERPQIGKPNLFAWDEGRTTYIGTLQEADNVKHSKSGAGDWAFSPLERTAEASPDGRWLAFLSQSELTHIHNVGRCKHISGTVEVVSGPCSGVFLYDSQTGELRCVSCNRVGAAPLGPAALPVNLNVAGASPQPRYLADSGRLIFDTQDSLVPTDTNANREDVYEWEPDGVGSCGAGSVESGCVSLISTGTGSADSDFLAMDEDGNNVFFTTRDRLVGADRDELLDLYDARVDGGFPQPVVPGECRGEACQQSAPQPTQSTPSSAGLAGESSAGGAPPTCKKGQVRRAGNCVKKKPENAKKKHHKKKRRTSRSLELGRKGGSR